MHRFFIFEPDKIENNRTIIVSDELLHQFCNVLKFHLGEQVLFLDNTGDEYLCAIENISKKEIAACVIEKRKNAAEPRVKICLYQAIPKNQEKLEMVLQKGTEVGVSEFVPMITARTEKESLNKIPRLQKILKESAEQSGRGIIPVLREPVKFEKILKSVSTAAGRVSQSPNKKIVQLLAHTQAQKSFKDISGDLRGEGSRGAEQINIFIGPEGGFTEQEIAAAEQAGAIICNFGPRVLRSETAGIVIPYLIQCY
ncbi:16S rRNA (uracil(1498)-N(3))-methyltransferase [Candidatus Peregrinibacteria bacterium]|nr:16S rRNA (uracil(1498)-N(3))-methyltransferase [Candidatus Peregrinibacteria bacterium]